MGGRGGCHGANPRAAPPPLPSTTGYAMRNTLATSWELVSASAAVLNRDRALLVFPLLSGVASVGLALSFLLPTLLVGGPGALFETSTPLGLLLGFLFYLSQYFVVFYFNAALVGAALIHLDGGGPPWPTGSGSRRTTRPPSWGTLPSPPPWGSS
jgi:hypothetical protein